MTEDRIMQSVPTVRRIADRYAPATKQAALFESRGVGYESRIPVGIFRVEFVGVIDALLAGFLSVRVDGHDDSHDHENNKQEVHKCSSLSAFRSTYQQLVSNRLIRESGPPEMNPRSKQPA